MRKGIMNIRAGVGRVRCEAIVGESESCSWRSAPFWTTLAQKIFTGSRAKPRVLRLTLIFRQAIQAIFRLIGASSPNPNPSLLSLLLLWSSRTTEFSLLRPPILDVSRLRSILALLLLLLWVYRPCPLIFVCPLPRSGSSFRCKFSCGDRETELGPEMAWLMVPVAVLLL